MYAIVDIETTGGNAGTGSITEIAILISDGKVVLHRFSTLVNPMRPIPVFIEKLTGINDAMVSRAPVFGEVAKEIFELLQNKVFIAHNVNFDFSFVAHQLAQHGYKLQSKKLCTVRLSRKIFTDLPRYSLGHLCRSLGIVIESRHRAMGDAEATAILFHKLLQEDREEHIQKMLKKGSREAYLPIHLAENDIEQLPNTPGIYYFHDKKGKIMYVGKAKRLKKRVTSHFSNNDVGKRKQELMRAVSRISYRECGNEFMMSIIESIEIKRLWPAFNNAQKRFEHRFGICSYTDQRGVERLGIVKKRKQIQTHINFNLMADGFRLLKRIAKEHSLCPKMCFIQDEKVECSGIEEQYCEGICEAKEDTKAYNKKVRSAIDSLLQGSPTLAVFGRGRVAGEQTCVLIGKNDLLATGFLQRNTMDYSKEELLELLEPASSNAFIQSMVLSYAEQYPEKTVYLD